MSLRRKLVYLHVAFASFSVIAATATIYGVQLHVRTAASSFERLVDRSNLVEHIRVEAQAQLVELHEAANGMRQIDESFLARREAFFTRLTELASFAGTAGPGSTWWSILDIGRELSAQTEQCLEMIRAEKHDDAKELLTSENMRYLLGTLDTRLRGVRGSLDTSRRQSVDQVLRLNLQLLGLAGLIGVSCAGLVIGGALLIRRWLITPITDLQVATREFARGNLTYRVTLDTNDELGSLAAALNEMAGSVGASEAKYRSLFENLRDAVIICDPAGVVVECRDADTHLLGIAPDAAVGKHPAEIWPQAHSPLWDWTAIVATVAGGGEPVRAADLRLPGSNAENKIVDAIAYPVEYHGTTYAAIVLRDVTERHRMQGLLRRAETMEAAETFARGIAHDFKNLLNSAVTTLSLIESTSSMPEETDRVRTALRACKQAAGLSSRLLRFTTVSEGTPELLSLSETVDLIIGSLDEPFLEPLNMEVEHDTTVMVRIDRDLLTQVILNLIRNAREAMPDGGRLQVAVSSTFTSDPLKPQAPSPHAVLTVSDTGCGMTAEVRARLFEPLFSTKTPAPSGSRGMGLAVAYAIVHNARGFIQVDSEIGSGTTFGVFLPQAPERDAT